MERQKIRPSLSMVFPLQADNKKVVQHAILWNSITGKHDNVFIKKGKNYT